VRCVVLCSAVSCVLCVQSLRRVLRAPMRYFDSTPVGQLLQRFSTDMDQVPTTYITSCIYRV
jgi:ABC-type multidrug transport system fused ATPase/permease subunit